MNEQTSCIQDKTVATYHELKSRDPLKIFVLMPFLVKGSSALIPKTDKTCKVSSIVRHYVK